MEDLTTTKNSLPAATLSLRHGFKTRAETVAKPPVFGGAKPSETIVKPLKNGLETIRNHFGGKKRNRETVPLKDGSWFHFPTMANPQGKAAP
jgi:hypothetical protein